MDKNELKKRVNEFAHRCVRLASALPQTVLGRIICGQLTRASTSAAANYRAACLAQSKKTFVAKVSIVIEECDESEFWLEFIIQENLLKKNLVENLLQEGHELTSIFVHPEERRAKAIVNHQSTIVNPK